jgi:hypothetical protein
MVDEKRANPDPAKEKELLSRMSDRQLFSRVLIRLVMATFKPSTGVQTLLGELQRREKEC